MKRILIFSLNYYPHFIGGAEVAIKEITDRVNPADIEFHMITLRFDSTLPKVEKIGNILVHRIGFARTKPSIADLRRFPLHLNKHLYQILAAKVAHTLHERYHYDAVWAMMAHASGIPAGTFKKRHREVPYLLTLQEGDPPEKIERMMRPVWSLFVRGFRRADELQAISRFLLVWGKRMGFQGEGLLIPNGVDVERFSAVHTSEELARMRTTLCKKDGDVLLITTSRLVHKNGIDTVIRALPLLPEHISFVVFGIGPDEKKLKVLAKELGVEPRVRFLGELSRKEIPLALSACDIFVRPSRSEGMGNSFIEAMAAGLPVIATQEGGIADFLFDEKRNPGVETTGWAVDVDAPEQIAAAVNDILENPQKRARIVASAKTLARTKYDWSLIARDMKALFDRLLG